MCRVLCSERWLEASGCENRCMSTHIVGGVFPRACEARAAVRAAAQCLRRSSRRQRAWA